ncbi:MAG: S8 family serine peptidase [Candidatus Omnitrophica bacterium]|nr:S8 family serine peptidase [Candidatus Omnitrophota bacterium]
MKKFILFFVIGTVIVSSIFTVSAFALVKEKAAEDNSPSSLAPDRHQRKGMPQNTADSNNSPEPEYAPGQLIIKLKEGKTLDDIKDLNTKYNVHSKEKIFKKSPSPKDVLKQLKEKHVQAIAVKEKKELSDAINAQEKFIAHLEERQKRAPKGAIEPDLDNIFLLNTDSGNDISIMAEEYKSNPAIEYVQFNRINEICMVPNDPYYSSSNSWGQNYDDLWGLKKINASQAWDISQGEGVVVAVIDTGVDYNHEDIAANIWANPAEIPNNNIDDDNNGMIDDIRGWDFSGDDSSMMADNDPIDYYGHGTHCAGTIAAIGNNNIGIIGVAPKAKIMPVKIFPNPYDSVCADAIRYAADMGADVLSNSWGPSSRNPSNPLVESAIEYAYAKGCVVVFAAGNYNDDVAYYSPANYPKVITVAASDQNDQKCYFSNYGAEIDVAAPGGGMSGNVNNILSLLAASHNSGFNSYIVRTNYLRLAGTSMACPHVAGVTALLLSKNSSFSNAQVKQAIRRETDPIISFLSIGKGRINALKTLQVDLNSLADIGNIANNGSIVSIYGSAYGPDFNYYTVEWAKTDLINTPATFSSTDVTLTNNGASPVTDNLFGTLDTTSVGEGFFIFRLTVFYKSGFSKTVYSSAYSVDRLLHPGWPYCTTGKSLSSPVISDLDNDGEKELIVTCMSGGVYVLNKDGACRPGWPVFTQKNISTIVTGEISPAIADIDQDGNQEIVIRDGVAVYVYNKDGILLPGWPVSTGRWWFYSVGTTVASPVIADINNDGQLEIIVAGTPETIYIFNRDGSNLSGWPKQLVDDTDPNTYNRITCITRDSPAVGDIDNDGDLEIVIQENNIIQPNMGNIYAFHHDGEIVQGWPQPIELVTPQLGAPSVTAPKIGDIDGDGDLEIVTESRYNQSECRIYVRHHNGEMAQGWPKYNVRSYAGVSGFALADVDNDGLPEIIASVKGSSSGSNVYIYKANGQLISTGEAGFLLHEAPLVVEINGDDFLDIATLTHRVYTTEYSGQMAIFDNNGNKIEHLSRYILGSPFGGSAAAGDLDGDGMIEIAAISEAGRVFLWDTNGMANNKNMPWPFMGRDLQHTGCYKLNMGDPPPPTPPIVTDTGEYTTSTTTLTANWTSTDPESGIAEYQYQITQDSTAGAVIKAWTLTGTATYVTAGALSLLSGKTYYFSVKAKSGASLWSVIGFSDGIKVDTTAPTTPNVTAIDSATKGEDLLAIWSSSDQESGIAEYQYQITQDSTTGIVVKSWTSTGTLNQASAQGLILTNGKTYYFGVKAKNSAGLWSTIGYSYGTNFDSTPPIIPVVTYKEAYTPITDQLSASWTSSDPESGISEYKYQITQDSITGIVVKAWTSTGTTASVTASGLTLINNRTYYFAVKAKNRVGLWSTTGYGKGIKVDTTPPSLPVVSDAGTYTTNATNLTANWSSQDAQSEIIEYQYRITQNAPTGTGVIIIKNWTSRGKYTSVTATGLSLKNGMTYYFSVKAKNAAEMWSNIGYSNGITYTNGTISNN